VIAGAYRRRFAPIGGHIISIESRAARPQLDWLTLSPSAPPSQALRRYQRSQRSLLGRWSFARAARRRTPLLGTLQVQFDELRVGLCRAQMRAHRRVRSVDGAVDPMAISALAQLAATMLIEVSVPEGLCWSARGLTVEHLRRAESTVVALARLDKTDWAETGLVGVPVTIGDAAGSEVARAVLSFAVAMRSD
jgi:acyl-coenzyme A thioesterase PaaI-like protein